MNLENNPWRGDAELDRQGAPEPAMDLALEQAMHEIRNDAVDDAVVEAAAARVWANLAAQAHSPLRNCSDFQSLIPDFKASRLPQARAMLVKDHLHECVACRRIYEGKVVAMPVATPRRTNYTARWAVAAGVLVAAGLSAWVILDQYGNPSGRAYVQALNGTLYEITANGIQVLALNQDLRDGVEIRTAKDSDAVLRLRDGSVVELRERSGFSTSQTASDLTIRLGRGSVIVQAAKRSSGHLFVSTADCRVAVTGTLFSVSSGLKGSRVSVIEGEVHVTQDNQEKVLRPGQQAVTSPNLEPVSVKDDISWSRDRDKLVQQLEKLRAGLSAIPLPQLRYSSKLLGRLPATTVFFASLPNPSDYLSQAQGVFNKRMADSPELRAWFSGHGTNVQTILEKVRTGSEYLGDEIAIFGFKSAGGQTRMPVFFAEVKRAGFADFLKKEKLPLTIEERDGLVVFGPDPGAVAEFATSLAGPGSFQTTPFYSRITESYQNGAGLLLCADIAQLGVAQHIGNARYFIAEEKQVNNQMETRASLGFEGPRSGMAAWLAAPSPMGTLDYVSPEATIVTAFVVRSPLAIVDELVGVQQHSSSAAEKAFADAKIQTGIDIRNDVAAALGGEFSLSLDGPAIPVPSWKLVVEVYDPTRMQNTLSKFVEAYNRQTVKEGGRPLRVAQEVFEGRTYYMIGGADGSPLTEAHFTFSDGYLIAGPTRALVSRALQVKTMGTSITHSSQFVAMEPRDRYNNFSALIYQNLGTTLAPIASLLGAFAPRGGRGDGNNPLAMLGNMKPTMIAAYGEPDRISVTSTGDLMGISAAGLVTGNLQNAVPFTQMMGTRARAGAFK